MTVYTYQSVRVLKILKSGQVYRAYPSRKFAREYAGLIDILGLHCQCPIFGNLKFHRKNRGGNTSDHVRLILKVPVESIRLTEYSEWADFMYMMQFTTPDHYANLMQSGTEGISQKKLDRTIASLKKQRKPWAYRVPQVILEEIRPEWLVDYKIRI